MHDRPVSGRVPRPPRQRGSIPTADLIDLMEWTHPGSCDERVAGKLRRGPARDFHESYYDRLERAGGRQTKVLIPV